PFPLCVVLERVVPPRRDHPAHHFQGLGRQCRATDLHAERGNQLGLHRVREQRDHPAALGAAKRGRERAVAGKLALFERHLAVALDAQELHVIADRRLRIAESLIANSTLGTRASQTSSIGWKGTRASTGIPNSRASASPASPANGPPAMFSMTPRHGAPRSRAACKARRTASSDCWVGMVTAMTGGGSGKSSASSAKRCIPGGKSTSSTSSRPHATSARNSRSAAASR